MRLFRANVDAPLLASLKKLTRAIVELESAAATAASVRPLRSSKSRRLGLSAPFDWSNPEIPDDALIVRTAASLRFEDMARLCGRYGVRRVRKVLQAQIASPLARTILARQLRNIEAAMKEDRDGRAA